MGTYEAIKMCCRKCRTPIGFDGYPHQRRFAFCESCARAEVGYQVDLKKSTKHLFKKRPTPFPDRIRNAAGRFVVIAIECGLLQRLGADVACVDCGRRARCYDHRDYSRPLEVEPVCTGCNNRRAIADQGEIFQRAEERVAEAVKGAHPHILRALNQLGYAKFLWDLNIVPANLARHFVFGMPGYKCERIETMTKGAVTRYDLRPDIFGPQPQKQKARAA